MPFQPITGNQNAVITPTIILNLQDGITQIERSQDELKDKLVAILRDKDIIASSTESISDLVYRFQGLQNSSLNSVDNDNSIIDIRKTVQSKQVQFLFMDGYDAQIKIRTYVDNPAEEVDKGTYVVDWGDGTIETYVATSGVKTHKFKAGTGEYYDGVHNQHVVTVTATVGQINGFGTAEDCKGTLAVACKDLFLSKPVASGFSGNTNLHYFDVIGGSLCTSDSQASMYRLFYNCQNLERVTASVCWSSVTSLESTFYQCYKLKNIDMGTAWNTINCTSFHTTFYSCSNLIECPGIITSYTTTMYRTFYACNRLERINCDIFDLRNNQIMTYTFYQCNALKKIPKLINTSKVTAFDSCFYNCQAIEKLDQDELDTSAAQTVSTMYYGCSLLQEAPRMDFNGVIKDSISIFSQCGSLYVVQDTFSFNSLIGSSPANNSTTQYGIDSMFYNCTSLTQAPTIIAPHVLSTKNVFSGCSSLVSVPKIINLPESLNIGYFFNACTSLSIAPQQINAPKTTYVDYLFASCTNMTSAPTELVFDEALTASYMFNACQSLVKPPTRLSLAKVANANAIFQNCYGLTTLPDMNIGGTATTINNIFNNCIGIQDLRGKKFTFGISSAASLFASLASLLYAPDEIHLPNATSINRLFNACPAMIQAPAIIDAPKASTISEVFYNCSGLKETPNYYFPNGTNASGFYYGCTSMERTGQVKTDSPNLNANYFLYNGTSLVELNVPVCAGDITYSNYMFHNATQLTTVNGAIDMGSGVGYANMFPAANTGIVGSITFKNLSNTFSFTGKSKVTEIRLVTPKTSMRNFDISNCGLGTSALNTLFEDLPTITTGQKITITGNPGANSCNKTIATKKGWTVV